MKRFLLFYYSAWLCFKGNAIAMLPEKFALYLFGVWITGLVSIVFLTISI